MRNPVVLVQIQHVEAILNDSGVRSFCMDCIRGPEGGCCQGCKFLGPDGCTNKPLACALWLCSRAQAAFPEASAKLDAINEQWPRQVANGFRSMSILAEHELTDSLNPQQ